MKTGVLVTGSTGLLGQAVLEELTRMIPPIRVTGLSRKGASVSVANHFSLAADLLDTSSDRILDNVEFSHLIHCAAVIPASMVDSSATQAAEMNCLMDDRIISLCHQRSARLIYVSSASVYGFGQGPWDEDSPTCAPGPYAVEKLRSEAKALDQLTDCVIFRVTAPYGPKQRTRTVLRHFIERALKDEDLLFHGNGERTQDFIAAADFASAVGSILNASNVERAAGVFNISGGSPISMKNLAELVIACIPSTKSRAAPSGQIDPQQTYRPSFDLRKAQDLLQWRPRITLKQGIERWIRVLSP